MTVHKIPDKFLVAFSFAGEERSLVKSIAIAVEQRLGRSKVFFDEWYEHYIAGTDADKKLQRIYREQSALVVLCVAKSYNEKPWTLAEHDVIRERVNRSRVSDKEEEKLCVLPVRVGEGEVEGISFNTIIPDVRLSRRTLDQTVELILNRLHLVTKNGQLRGTPSVSPIWPDEATSFEHGLADRLEQWPVIQRFMTESSPKRILIFKGPSNYSKSALLNAACRYARILGVPTAYVDFKDTQFLRQTNLLERVRLDLCTILPSLVEDSELTRWKLLGALRKSTGSALILLDTYEKVKETKELVEWIETQLLAEVEQCKQLRFLIAGQKVPERSARWHDLAEEIELNRINDERAWLEWIQRRNPNIDNMHVESIVGGLEGVPGTISTVLVTFAKTRVTVG